jgi:hypothetical protein
MDFCFTRCFSYYVEWQVHKLQTKKLPFITWFITSHLDVYNSMEHAHPSERCTHSTYICGSHIESSSNQKKIYANSMSMASVSPYICSEPTDLKSNSATFNFVKNGKMKTDTQVLLISIAL